MKRARLRPLLAALSLLGTSGSCGDEGESGRAVDTALVDLALRGLEPGALLPGTEIVVEGDSFVDSPWGQSFLVLEGEVTTETGTTHEVLRLPATFTDFNALTASFDQDAFESLGGVPGQLEGFAVVEVESEIDGRTYRSAAVDIDLQLAEVLAPEVTLATPSSVIFANEPLRVQGDGLLLPGEGVSVALVQGCFARTGGDSCVPIEPQWIPISVAEPFERSAGIFEFSPQIAGIDPGRFEGTVVVQNEHNGGQVLETAPMAATWDLVEPTLFGVDTQSASLGRFVTIEGAGFVGGASGGNTVVRFAGTFTPAQTGIPLQIDELLFPEFVDGRHVRYVINDDDGLSASINIRYEPGLFEGLVTPITSFGDQEVEGDPTPFGFALEPVRQVVWINFSNSYKESLRLFGLRAVDSRIRARVAEVLRRDFATVNVDVRTDVPSDYALYTQVDISGPDPNALGLLGYDNTPGKDTENIRLYDRIGGANALTQEDGFPGFGGVFIESLFGYSEHPGELAEPVRTDLAFDALFDPFRPDQGGQPVLAADLAGDLPLVDSDDCPAAEGERPLQIACAIRALGTLVGSTVSHEVGHSLGLADPYGPAFHNSGDVPDRLMDADRPFEERAELRGAGPSRFCADEYDYLRTILPSAEPYDVTPRAACY